MDDYAKIFNARGHFYNEAVIECPLASESERQAVIERLHLRPGQRVGDAPAGGGYLADGIRQWHGSRIPTVCIEPASRFAAGINRDHEIVVAPLHQTGLASASLDAIASLAGLHHVDDRDAVYREWKRLLVAQGRLVVADVQAETGTAEFLNGFVNTHTPGGHDGNFFQEHELTERLTACGFENVHEELVNVPWHFVDIQQMVRFSRQLFAIQSAAPDAVLASLRETVGTDEQASSGTSLRWQLRIATANNSI